MTTETLLETRNVFIDTQVFSGLRLDLNHRILNIFLDKCQSGELKSYTTDIVVREIKRKLDEQIESAIAAHKKFKKEAINLKGSPLAGFDNLFIDIDAGDARSQAHEALEKFIKDSNTQVLSANSVCPEDVFDLYFSVLPPFGPKGKTKEFPDAFTLLSLVERFRHEKIYVVSEDDDIAKFCKTTINLHHESKIATVLDHCVTHKNILAQKAKQSFENNKQVIIDKIGEEIRSFEVVNASDWDDSEVDSFNVRSISIDNVNIVEVEDDYGLFNFDIVVNYVAVVSGPDFSNAVYDVESAQYVILNSSTATETGEVDLEAEVVIKYHVEKGELVVDSIEEQLLMAYPLIEIYVL